MRRNFGFTIIEILVGATIIGVVALVSASIIESQSSITRYAQIKTLALDAQEKLQATLEDPGNCSCQINPDLTLDNSNDAALQWPATAVDGSASINVKRIVAGCALNSPVVVEEGQALGSDLTVSKVDFASLRPTGTAGEWSGIFRVLFNNPGGRVSLAPIEVKMIVSTTVAGGNLTVNTCKGPTAVGGGGGGSSGHISSCGALAMAGPPDGLGTFCIEPGLRSPDTFFQAKINCSVPSAGLPAGQFGPGYVCQLPDYYVACTMNLLTPQAPNQEFWLNNSDSESDVTGRPGSAKDCRSYHWEYLKNQTTGVLNLLPYRCCWR